MFLMKDNKVGPALVKMSSSPSYTLAELETLIQEWLSTTPIPASGDLTRELVASNLLAWLGKKEREGNERSTKV